MTDSAGAATRGVHHVGLTVPNLDETRRFFIETLGYEQVGEKPDYPAAFVSDGHTMITLWQAEDPRPFDRRKTVGLHHLALAVEDEAKLAELHVDITNADGAEIEFAPEPLGEGPTHHMMCTIPGGVRLELIAPR